MSLFTFSNLPEQDLNMMIHYGKTKNARYFMLVSQNVDSTLLETYTIIDDNRESVSIRWERIPSNNNLYYSKSPYNELNVVGLTQALFINRLGPTEAERIRRFITKTVDVQTLGNVRAQGPAPLAEV